MRPTNLSVAALCLLLYALTSPMFGQCKIGYNPVTGRFDCINTGIAGPAGPTGPAGPINTIADEGVALTQRGTVNFIGTRITCADNLGLTRTDCTVTAENPLTFSAPLSRATDTISLGIATGGFISTTGGVGLAQCPNGNSIVNTGGTSWGCWATPGTVTNVATGCGMTGGAITTTGTVAASITVNAQTLTTYTYLTGDCGKLLTHSNVAAIAGTLPQAGVNFPSGWWMDIQNRGAGTLTITPSISTIDGAASLSLTQNQGVRVVSDGTNYFTQRGVGSAAGGGVADPGANGFMARTALNVSAARTLQAGTGINITNPTGLAGDPVLSVDPSYHSMLTGSASIDFLSTPAGGCSAASTISVIGAALGDYIAAGRPSGLDPLARVEMWVSAVDTVSVVICNMTGAAYDPAILTFKVGVIK